MSRKVLIITLIISIGINLGLLGFMALDAVRETRFHHERRPLPHWFGTIEGITPEQTDLINTIMAQGKGPIEALRNDLFQQRCELNLLITKQNPDLVAIDAKITEISGLQAQMEKLIVQQIIAIRQILTAEQQQMLTEYIGRCMMPPPPGRHFGDGIRLGRPMGRGWGRGGPNR